MAGHPKRISFRTFDGTTLRGLYYSVDAKNAPIVILTAGLSFLKEHFIDAFAFEFQKVGIAALCYDHRNWGESDGQPRQHTAFWQQVEDYSDAIMYATSLGPAIDANRICIWGAGHAGGCVVTMVPFISGSEDSKYYPEGYLDEANQERVDDIANSLDWGSEAKYVLIFARPNDLGSAPAVIGVPEAYEFYRKCKERSDVAGSKWQNEMTLQSLWYGSRWEPTGGFARIADRPVLYVAAEHDKFILLANQKEAFEKIVGPKEMVILNSEHLDTYMGNTFLDNVVKQVSWLKKWL